MLKLVDTIGIEEIELYVQLVRVKPQVNQSVDTYTNLLLGGILMLRNWTMGVGLIVLQLLQLIDGK